MQAARFPHYTAAELAPDRTLHALALLLATVGVTWLLVASALAASAACNSCGAYIQAQGRMRFNNATWHGLFLLGAGLHRTAVADQIVNRYARGRTIASCIVWRFPCSEACDGDA
jgi:predicted membrane channel-forming protein YqfA (hemolysin III family)